MSGSQKLAGNSILWAHTNHGPTHSPSPNTFLFCIHGFTAEQHTKSLWFILPLGTRGSEVYCLQILKIANSSHNRKLILHTIPQSSPSIGHPCEPAAPAGAKAPDCNSSSCYFGPVMFASNTKGNQQNGLFLGKRENLERNRSEQRDPQKMSCRFKPGELLRFALGVPGKKHFRRARLGMIFQN